MKSKKPMIVIEWADAHAQEEGTWVFLEDVKDKGEYIVASIGWLLDKKSGAQTGHVSIAQSLGLRDGVGDHIIHIPNAMVRAIYLLSGKKITLKDLKSL